MNKNNSLERHLLTRCFSSDAKIEELLSTRYSNLGDQKPVLVLMPTGRENAKEKSLFHSERKNGFGDNVNKERIISTRQQLKLYVKETTKRQKRLIKKLQLYSRTKTDKSKPFPIELLIKHYSIPKFEDFIGLNTLWQKYMQDLLFSNDKIPNLTTLLPKLASADFVGCMLTVIRSANNNLVGTRGIVIWDAQHSFILCVPRMEDSKEWKEKSSSFSPSEQVGGLKIIPKSKCLFSFEVILPSSGKDSSASTDEECIGFTIIGSRFELRSIDRSGRKFKNHKVEDII